MEIACRLQAEAKKQGGVEALPFAAVGQALEVIPRTLCQNCGADTILGFGKPIINLPKNKNSSTESPINLRRHVVCADFF